MDGFEKRLIPLKSTASPKSTGFGENDENDSTQDKMIPKFQNQRKNFMSPIRGFGENDENDSTQDKMIPKFQNQRKHFMSPTISAASKAASPRKKILGERKENLGVCDTQDHKKFNLYWNSSPQHSSRSDRFSHRNASSREVSESEDDGDVKFSDHSSTKAYDPSRKNYLSPRPKYLRFDPNKRREIVERLEREVRDELISSSESGEVSDEHESSTDEVEDSCCVEKTKEVNVDITVAEDETDEEEDEAEEKGWCLGGVVKVVLMLVACLLSTSYICSMNCPTPSPTQQAIWNLRDGYRMIQRQTLEFLDSKMHNVGSFEMEVGDDFSEVEAVDFDEGYVGTEESIEAEIVEDGVENLEWLENDEDKDAEFEFVQAAKTDETITADSLKVEDNFNEIKASESEIIGGGGVESETQNSVWLMEEKTDENGDAGGSELPVLDETPKESKTVDDIGFHEKLTDSVTRVDEMEGSNLPKFVPEKTPVLEEIVPAPETFTDSVDEMEDSNLPKFVPQETPELEEIIPSQETVTDTVDETRVEMEKEGWNPSAAVIGTFAASLFSTLLAVVYRSKKASSKESKTIPKPRTFAVEEKPVDRKVEFLARPSSPPHPTAEARKEFNHHIYAPSVELIGEIEVGSQRSYQKHDTEFEESSATFSTIDHTPTKLQSVTASSPSYGGFKKKEEGGRVGDATPAATSVRRSSRLRNRATVITSPN